MKINEIPAVYDFYQDLDLEVIRAQRMAEFEQLAKYRALKIQAYKEWSKDPKATSEKILVTTKATGEAIAKELLEKLVLDPSFLKYQHKPQNFRARPIVKFTPPKLKWYQKLFKKALSCLSFLS